MFEAHTAAFSDFDNRVTAARTQQYSLPKPVQLIHSHYRCPVSVWFAEGKRKDRKGNIELVWSIYVEYRRQDNSHAYKVIEVPRQQNIPESLWIQLAELELNDICPLTTRVNPVISLC